MSCILNEGIYELPCATIAGVDKVWIGTYSDLNTFGLDANNIITSVVSGTPTLYKFVQDSEKAGVMSTGEFGDNLTVRNLTTLSIKLFDLSNEMKNIFLTLQKAPLMAIVKSVTGQYIMLGVETPGRASTSTIGFGVANADLNGVDLTITWKTQNAFYFVSEAVLNASGGIQLIDEVIS